MLIEDLKQNILNLFPSIADYVQIYQNCNYNIEKYVAEIKKVIDDLYLKVFNHLFNFYNVFFDIINKDTNLMFCKIFRYAVTILMQNQYKVNMELIAVMYHQKIEIFDRLN